MKEKEKKTNKKAKNNTMKVVKILTITLLIVLVSMIGFFGIYTQNKNQMKNNIKDYSYSMGINGTRTITLAVNTESKQVVKDSNGNVIKNATDEQIQQNGYTKEDVLNNNQDVLTVENYKKSKEIVEKRLKKLEIQEYNVSLNEKTGEIVIEVPEDTNTDNIVSNLNTIGKFEITDSETKEVLLNNSNIKSSDVLYNTTSSGTSVYLQIEFNKDGKKKLEEISKTYVKAENNTTENNTTSSTTDNETNTTDTTNTTTENSTEKKITMKIDDEEIMTTSFDQAITTGKIQLTVGSASTDSDKIQSYATQAKNIATVLDSGNLPIKYDINKNEYILSDITENELIKIEVAIAIIAVVGIIFLICKYKINGLLTGIAYVGLAAIYMLIIRYTNVIISVESIFGIIVILLLNYMFSIMILDNIIKCKKEKKENVLGKATAETYKQFFSRIIPLCIIAITFCFVKWMPISSFGMITFWGITIIALYNVIVTRTLLKIKGQE